MKKPGAFIEFQRKYSDDYSRLLSERVIWHVPDEGEKWGGNPQIARLGSEFLDYRPKAGDVIDLPNLPWKLCAIEDYRIEYDGVAVMRVGWLPIVRVVAYRVGMFLLNTKERLIMTAWIWGLGRRPQPGYPITWHDVHIIRWLFGDD